MLFLELPSDALMFLSSGRAQHRCSQAHGCSKHQSACSPACRFLNSTAAKWKFRAGDVEGAEATAALFTKDGDQVNNLFDMQCTWYEIECGRAWLRRGEHGKVMTSTEVSAFEHASGNCCWCNMNIFGCPVMRTMLINRLAAR